VIETSNPLPERALIIHQEADLMSLVERLLHDYALFFYEIHDPDLSRLLICDKLKTEENPMQSRWTADERVVERYRYGKKGSVLELETECLDMKLGSVFTVQQDQYIVSAITHEFDESQHMILSSHARVKSRYRNTVLAQPINIPWQSSYVPRVSQATLRTAMIHRFDQGQYQLILESDRDKKNPKPTSPVPALTPYGGTEYGFHCPLHEDMQVLTLDRRGHPDEPLIMGALYQGREPHLNRLRTQAGHELLMDDTLNEESIRLSSAQESCYLHMEAKKSEELMTLCNQAGGIDIHAGATMTQYAGDTMMIETSSDLIMSSQGHLQISTEDSHIMMSAGAKIHMQAGASWHAQIGQDMKLDITGHYLHQSLGGYQLEVHEGDYTVRVEKGGLQWSAHSDLRVGTEHGDIHMDCGLSSLHILSSGEIKINANILKLVATQIEAPQAAFSINT
jgi:type VI secretion system secreted protein VgrG